MKIALNYGHTKSGAGCGAIGFINESLETRILGVKLSEYLKNSKVSIIDSTVDSATSSSAYLQQAVKKANSSSNDLAVSIHFNAASSSSANGVEVWVYDKNSKAKDAADRICKNISNVSGLKNRGVKYNSNLYWLKYTNAPALLIEVCFVSNKEDTEKYKNNLDKIAKAIAESLINKKIEDKPIEQNDSGYRVIAGFYKDKNNALRIQEELKKLGYSSFLEYYTIKK